MYTDMTHWNRVRARVMKRGESTRSVAATEGISRNTVRKMLRFEQPPGYRRTAANSLKSGARSRSSGPWKDVAGVVRSLPSRETAGFLSSLFRALHSDGSCEAAEQRLRTWGFGAKPVDHAEQSRLRWMRFMYDIERGCAPVAAGLDPEQCERLMRRLLPESANQRHKALSILAHASGISARELARHLGASRNGVRSYLRDFEAGGVDTLFNRKQRARMTDNAVLRDAVFTLLHEPPSASGINRTTWKMADLQRILAARGHQAGADTIRSIIRSAGYAWKSAKVVLTSTDSRYEEKLARIRDVLGRLQPDEHFFSIDEFGPFAVKAKPGRLLTAPGVQPSVPQWQKSKGCLILTAALELSANQVTHFYSTAKNTDEMIRMANTLLERYADASTLYLSWDAASWHLSKKLTTFVDEHNAAAQVSHRPLLELAPLPASAQFLNVIESVFSGMARAIIHNSDYESVDAAMSAIDRYFLERNQHFETHPKRAGKAIWGLERTACEFSDANNCKDPAYR